MFVILKSCQIPAIHKIYCDYWGLKPIQFPGFIKKRCRVLDFFIFLKVCPSVFCLFEWSLFCYSKNTFYILFYNYNGPSKQLNLNINAYIYLFGNKNEAPSKLP
jgi:hypothetical protein